MPRFLNKLWVATCFGVGFLACALAVCGVAVARTRQSQDPPPASQTQSSPTSAPTDVKSTKKVWTNEEVGGLNGTVSVVGNSKSPAKSSPGKPADAKYIADVRKQLQKLRSQLDDTKKELADLKDFQAGKPASSSGYPVSRGSGRIPVDQQISSLEAKQKDLEDKIDTLLDEARKKGVTPGDLR
jgi:hypothetical protein